MTDRSETPAQQRLRLTRDWLEGKGPDPMRDYVEFVAYGIAKPEMLAALVAEGVLVIRERPLDNGGGGDCVSRLQRHLGSPPLDAH